MTQILCTPEVKMIAHSIGPLGIPIKTFQLKYWRAIHAELMTHRLFSRNAGSSRARPVKGIIDQVLQNPWGPSYWGMNQKGMKANIQLHAEDIEEAKKEWRLGAMRAAKTASALNDLKLHKQIANRVLEPFTHIDVIVTSTSYNNWYALRNHKDAQPEIKDLAALMLEVDKASEPKQLDEGDWHLPYITPEDMLNVEEMYEPVNDYNLYKENVINTLLQISSARCARISYKNFEGNFPSIEEDLQLYHDLVIEMPVHASPTEHQATPLITNNVSSHWPKGVSHIDINSNLWSGNLCGWVQHRKLIPNEFVPG